MAALRSKQNHVISTLFSPITLRFQDRSKASHSRRQSRVSRMSRASSRMGGAPPPLYRGYTMRGDGLEPQFLSSYFYKYNASNRWSILFSVLIWALFIINDVNKDADGQRHYFVATVTLRAVDCLIGVLCFAALGSKWLEIRHTAYNSLYEQAIVFTGMMTFGLSQVLFGVWQGNTLDPTYSMFMILIPSMSPTFFHQRFLFTLSFSSLLVGLFIILTAATGAYTSVTSLITTIIGVTCANVLFILFAYRRERQIREDFLSARQLAADEAKSQALPQRHDAGVSSDEAEGGC